MRIAPYVLLGVVTALGLGLAGGCKSDPDKGSPPGEETDPGPPDPPTAPACTALAAGGSWVDVAAVAPVCASGTHYQAGTPAFREASAAWSLDTINPTGVRLSVVDIDGDGWADLVVRRPGVNWDGRDGVRHTWLLHNEHGRFVDITEASGLLLTRTASRGSGGRPGEVIVWADVDNDGDLDAYTGTDTTQAAAAPETSEIMLNQGSCLFHLGPAASDLRRAEGKDTPGGAAFVDVNRDGRIDLWVPQNANASGNPQQSRLYTGDGTGAFTEITEAAGLKTKSWQDVDDISAGLAHPVAWSAAACDLNGDGADELLAASYGRAPNHLWQADPNAATPTFANRSVLSGYAYDDDFTWQDNQNAMCYCEDHRDAEGCADVGAPSIDCRNSSWSHDTDREPFRLGGNSGTTMCADLDNDGAFDLVTTEIKHWWAGSGSDASEILHNTGATEVTFVRPGRAVTGVTLEHASVDWDEGQMTGAVFDFDNDGWSDIYIGGSDYPGNIGLLYRQDAPLHFVAVPVGDGIDMHRSHGVAVADFDRDGDLDVVVGHSAMRCSGDCYATFNVRFFENVLGSEGNWIQLQLDGGEGTNRAAIGARVTVAAGGVVQTQEVGGGYGHFGMQNDLVLHFGLGAACAADITVRWPNQALTTEHFQLGAGYRYRIAQGAAPLAWQPE